MPDQEEQTERFLKTNGPPPGCFTPDVPHYALEGATEREKYLLEMVSIGTKQNGWMIPELIGLKGANRSIIARLSEGDKMFSAINEDRAKFAAWQAKWLSRRTVIRNAIVAVIMALILPFLSILAVEWIKHHFHWQ